MKKFIALALLIFASIACHTEVIQVDKNSSSSFVSYVPTQTLYWKAINAKALVVLVPGGNGNLGLKRDDTEIDVSFYKSLKALSEPNQVYGQFDVVVIDFPLALNQRDLSSRASNEHMVRIERVVDFYRHKTHLPIWLMGHSNAGVSLGHFIRYLQSNKKSGLLSGMIASGIRNESSFIFNESIEFPVLFIHHTRDECPSASSVYSMINYDRLKRSTPQQVQFEWMNSGESESKDPCQSGFHMYYGSGIELPNIIREFLMKHSNN